MSGPGAECGRRPAFQDRSPLGYDPNDRGRAGLHLTSPRPPQSKTPDFQAATVSRTAARPYDRGETEWGFPAVARVALQTHRPHCCGWTGVVWQSRTNNLRRIRLRRWHTSLAQGTRPCATIWYASSPSRSAQNQPLGSASKQTKLHTDLDHAIATCFTRIGHVRFPHEEARPATRLGAPA